MLEERLLVGLVVQEDPAELVDPAVRADLVAQEDLVVLAAVAVAVAQEHTLMVKALPMVDKQAAEVEPVLLRVPVVLEQVAATMVLVEAQMLEVPAVSPAGLPA